MTGEPLPGVFSIAGWISERPRHIGPASQADRSSRPKPQKERRNAKTIVVPRRWGYETPLRRGWRRQIYELVLRQFWTAWLDARQAEAVGRDWRRQEILAQLPRLVRKFAGRILPLDQEMFLAAMRWDFCEVVGPIDETCACAYCQPARERLQREARVPRHRRIWAQFVRVLIRHLEVLLDSPNDYDRDLGAPIVNGGRSND